MKEALGDIIDPVSLQAMEVSAVMTQAGASKEEIEEMMALLLSQGAGVSPDFLEAVKEAMTSGGKVDFSLIKSHFRNESINLNFVLVSRCFENSIEAL